MTSGPTTPKTRRSRPRPRSASSRASVADVSVKPSGRPGVKSMSGRAFIRRNYYRGSGWEDVDVPVVIAARRWLVACARRCVLGSEDTLDAIAGAALRVAAGAAMCSLRSQRYSVFVKESIGFSDVMRLLVAVRLDRGVRTIWSLRALL